MPYSDSHCHLTGAPSPVLDKAVKEAKARNIAVIVGMGMNVESSAEMVHLAQTYQVVAGVGIHPWNAIPPTDEIRDSLDKLARNKEVKVIGEVGLDYARNPDTKSVQKELLRYELSLAKTVGLPVNIHSREAHQDMIGILKQEKGIRGIIHGFNGDTEMLKDWLDLGFYISIGVRGFVTNEIPALIEAVRQIPADRLITETDSSPAAPGGLAEVLSVARKLASLRGVSAEEIGNTTTTNLKQLLRL